MGVRMRHETEPPSHGAWDPPGVGGKIFTKARLEDQVGVGRDSGRRSLLAVAQFRRDDRAALAAFLHAEMMPLRPGRRNAGSGPPIWKTSGRASTSRKLVKLLATVLEAAPVKPIWHLVHPLLRPDRCQVASVFRLETLDDGTMHQFDSRTRDRS